MCMRRFASFITVVCLLLVLAPSTASATYEETFNYCNQHVTPACETFWTNHPPIGPTGDWVMDFHDEFEGSGSIDTSKWLPYWFTLTNGFSDSANSSMTNCNDPNNVGRYQGELILASYANSDPDCQLKGVSTMAPYAGSTIMSRELFEDDNGVWEWYANYAGSGTGSCDVVNWQSAWTNGDEAGYGDGEIDVAETGSTGCVRTNIHYGNDQVVNSSNMGGPGWHSYTMKRNSLETKVWVDGVLTYTETSATPTFAGDPHYIVAEMAHQAGRDTDADAYSRYEWIRHWSYAA